MRNTSDYIYGLLECLENGVFDHSHSGYCEGEQRRFEFRFWMGVEKDVSIVLDYDNDNGFSVYKSDWPFSMNKENMEVLYARNGYTRRYFWGDVFHHIMIKQLNEGDVSMITMDCIKAVDIPV